MKKILAIFVVFGTANSSLSMGAGAATQAVFEAGEALYNAIYSKLKLKSILQGDITNGLSENQIKSLDNYLNEFLDKLIQQIGGPLKEPYQDSIFKEWAKKTIMDAKTYWIQDIQNLAKEKNTNLLNLYPLYKKTIIFMQQRIDKMKKEKPIFLPLVLGKLIVLPFEKLLEKTKEDYQKYLPTYNKQQVKEYLDAAAKDLFLDNKIVLSNFDLKDDKTKTLKNNLDKALLYLQIFIDNSKSEDLPPIFNKIVEFNKYFADKIKEISASLKDLPKNVSNDPKFKQFGDNYEKIMGDIRGKITALSSEIKKVTTVVKAKREAKELMLYLVDNIYRSVYEKLATDVNTYIKNIGL